MTASTWGDGWGSPDLPENAERIGQWVWCPDVWAVLTDDPCAYAYEHPRDCRCDSRFPLSVGGSTGNQS